MGGRGGVNSAHVDDQVHQTAGVAPLVVVLAWRGGGGAHNRATATAQQHTRRGEQSRQTFAEPPVIRRQENERVGTRMGRGNGDWKGGVASSSGRRITITQARVMPQAHRRPPRTMQATTHTRARGRRPPRGDERPTRTQATSFTKCGFREMPAAASKMDDALSPTKSADTTSSSVYFKMPAHIRTHTRTHTAPSPT